MEGIVHWLQINGWLVTAISAAVAATIAVTLYFKNKKRKTLDFLILTDIPVLSPEGAAISEQVRVVVHGETIDNPRLVSVLFANTGNQEIVADDFLLPFTAECKGGKIVSASIGDASEETVSAEVHDDHTVTVDCLNAGEHVVVQYLVEVSDDEDEDFELKPKYRVRGATRAPQEIDTMRTRRVLRRSVLIEVIFLWAIAPYFLYKLWTTTQLTVNDSQVGMTVLFGFVLLFVALSYYLLHKFTPLK